MSSMSNVIKKVKTKTTVAHIGYDASDWQLFTESFSPEIIESVAENLNHTLKHAINSGDSYHDVKKTMLLTMESCSEYGAADSEPRWLLEATLDYIFEVDKLS